jgi:hypothetical protein
LALSFKAYEFEGMGHTYHVFFMVRDESRGEHLPPAINAKERISQALRGKRIESREVIEVLVVNSENETSAWESTRALIEPHLVVSRPD